MSRCTIILASFIAIAGLTAVVIADNRMVNLSEQQVTLSAPLPGAVAALGTQVETASVQIEN